LVSGTEPLGAIVSVPQNGSGQPLIVARKENDVWLQIAVDEQGIVPSAFYALYDDFSCGSAPYVPVETNPAPAFRTLQLTARGETTGYYAANPLVMRAFNSMSPLGHPEQCDRTAGTGWDAPLLVGPVEKLDLSRFTLPFAVQ
jgi:hypothetical protein